MKIPLKYQSTEYDCGPTSLLNAVNFLFDREDISPDVLKYIILYTLDGYNKKGEAGKKGSTGMVMLGWWHYVLLTGVDQEYMYLFDPYYRKRPFKEDTIEMITDEPTKMNRKIKYTIMNSEGNENYALGKMDTRECLLIFNTKTMKTMDDIEYII